MSIYFSQISEEKKKVIGPLVCTENKKENIDLKYYTR